MFWPRHGMPRHCMAMPWHGHAPLWHGHAMAMPWPCHGHGEASHRRTLQRPLSWKRRHVPFSKSSVLPKRNHSLEQSAGSTGSSQSTTIHTKRCRKSPPGPSLPHARRVDSLRLRPFAGGWEPGRITAVGLCILLVTSQHQSPALQRHGEGRLAGQRVHGGLDLEGHARRVHPHVRGRVPRVLGGAARRLRRGGGAWRCAVAVPRVRGHGGGRAPAAAGAAAATAAPASPSRHNRHASRTPAPSPPAKPRPPTSTKTVA